MTLDCNVFPRTRQNDYNSLQARERRGEIGASIWDRCVGARREPQVLVHKGDPVAIITQGQGDFHTVCIGDWALEARHWVTKGRNITVSGGAHIVVMTPSEVVDGEEDGAKRDRKSVV